jgi:hypothetical protein
MVEWKEAKVGIKHLRHAVRRVTSGFGLGPASESETIRRVALDVARLNLGDEEASTRLRKELQPYAEDAGHSALAALNSVKVPSGYLTDRARRLLDSVMNDRPVEPTSVNNIELFEREERLGQLSIADGYGVLIEHEPALKELRDSVDPAGKENTGRRDWTDVMAQTRVIRQQAKKIVGPKSKHPDGLLRSNLALDIAYRYLYALSGYTDLGELDTVYFSAPNRVSSGSIEDKG